MRNWSSYVRCERIAQIHKFKHSYWWCRYVPIQRWPISIHSNSFKKSLSSNMTLLKFSNLLFAIVADQGPRSAVTFNLSFFHVPNVWINSTFFLNLLQYFSLATIDCVCTFIYTSLCRDVVMATTNSNTTLIRKSSYTKERLTHMYSNNSAIRSRTMSISKESKTIVWWLTNCSSYEHKAKTDSIVVWITKYIDDCFSRKNASKIKTTNLSVASIWLNTHKLLLYLLLSL